MLLVSMLTAAFNIQPIASQPSPLGLDVKIEPEHPTERDQVNVTVIIPDVPSISYGINFSTLIRVDNEFSVDINVSVPWIVLWVYVGNVTHTYDLGKLSEGSYNFSATAHYWYQLPNGTWPSWPSNYSYGKSFAVSPLPSIDRSPTISFFPHEIYLDEQTRNFTVSVNIENLKASHRLVGVSFELEYDSVLVSFVGIIDGFFWKDFGDIFTTFMISEMDFPLINILLLPPYTRFPEGNGTLAVFNFAITAPANSTIRLKTSAVDDGGNIIIIPPLPDESDYCYLRVTWNRADLNFDGKVDILDLSVLAKAFASQPGNYRWNTNVDIDGNRIINIIDAVKIAQDFGEHQ